MRTRMRRIPGAGRVDFARPLSFRFDGRPYQGLRGDTLTSALLANGVMLAGRSFKYHRRRGFMAAGAEESGALFELGKGERREPNLPASQVELVAELEATSQNRTPSLQLDLAAVNQKFERFLGAGFYYKTFMGPTRSSWKLYEYFIRRAAGLGRAPEGEDPDAYESANGFAEVLVIGAGPAGLAAAATAARSGERVILVEQDFVLGGSLLAESKHGEAEEWLRRTIEFISNAPNVRVMTRTACFGAYDGNCFGLVETLPTPKTTEPATEAGGTSLPRSRFWTIRAERVLLATGSTERPFAFRDNDLPGVVLAGAARLWLRRWSVLAGREIVVAGAHDGIWRTARDLMSEATSVGASVSVVDARSEGDVAKFPALAEARALGVQAHFGLVPQAAYGRGALAGVVLAPWNATNATCERRRAKRLSADLLCLSGGFSPNLHLWSQRGLKPEWSEQALAFVPKEGLNPHGWRIVGAARGGVEYASGPAWRAAVAEGEAGGAGTPPPQSLPPDGARAKPLWVIRKHNGKAPRHAFVDFQGDVTVEDLELAVREGYTQAEHLKRYTATAMGTDQGKTSACVASAILADLRGLDSPGAVGGTTFRPPWTPISIGAIAGRHAGRHFRAVRRSPLHDRHIHAGARWLETGPWLRPRYYPVVRDETATDGGEREAKAVRTGVGIFDISTLGKILIQGPDAAEFLERVYVNSWDKLAVGRVRYGVMLRDDGFAWDDGTTTRISEDTFFMTTTTANAAPVLARLEFLLQTAWHDLEVHLTSVSDCWAGVAVSGPKSRDLMRLLLPNEDLSDEALPYMGARALTWHGVAARLHRVSFSGERAFEFFVEAPYGEALWEQLEIEGAALGLVRYGLEASDVLRIEKGHVAAPELDGRTTLNDLGLAKMSTRRTGGYVGSVLQTREALVDGARAQLVGLRSLKSDEAIPAGAVLFSTHSRILGHGEGWVSSWCRSPQTGCWIALGFLAEGAARHGQTVICANPADRRASSSTVRAEVVSPHFFDPQGERLRG